jgi:hypothetical protein
MDVNKEWVTFYAASRTRLIKLQAASSTFIRLRATLAKLQSYISESTEIE